MSSLADAIESDLAWREAELGSLKLLAAREDQKSVRYRALLRALWCLLYAHYEGFFKYTWDLYLETIERLAVPRRDATEELARFSLKTEFKTMKGDLSDAKLWSYFTSDFASWMAQAMTFNCKLETDSNLWPSVARKNLTAVGLPCSVIDANELKLSALVTRRNDIAHGKPMVIKTLSDYQPYEDAAVLAMHELGIAVLESVESKAYLLPASVGPPATLTASPSI